MLALILFIQTLALQVIYLLTYLLTYALNVLKRTVLKVSY